MNALMVLLLKVGKILRSVDCWMMMKFCTTNTITCLSRSSLQELLIINDLNFCNPYRQIDRQYIS